MLQPQLDKIAAVRDIPSPTDLSSLRAALGLFSYYRKFVPHFSTITFPLNSLMKKDRHWVWGETQAAAINKLKEELCGTTVLQLPYHYKPFILTTDWSQKGMGAILSQVGKDGVEHPICYASRSCNPAEPSRIIRLLTGNVWQWSGRQAISDHTCSATHLLWLLITNPSNGL